MANNDLNLLQLFGILKKRAVLAGAIVVGCFVFFCALYFMLPKKYKSTAQLTIYSRYFQNPLVRDFISEQYDPTEMRTQREALIHGAINDAFVDQIAEQFHLYRSSPESAKRTAERDDLRKRFEIYPLNADTYEVGFVANDPGLARDVAQKSLDRVINNLVEERRKTISSLRDAVRGRMEAMVLFKNAGPNSLGSSSRKQIESELAETREQIANLLQQYTEQHPAVVKLKNKANLLERWLNRNSAKADAAARPESLADAQVDPGSKDVYQDLLKKYNYLNVALDMEQVNGVNYYSVISAPELPAGPVAPRLATLAAYGLTSGVLLAFFALLLGEFITYYAADAEKKATFWGVPLLGTLPSLDWNQPAPRPEEPITINREAPNAWN